VKKIGDYGFLEIFDVNNEGCIEIRFSDTRIYDGLNKRVNLFHIFNASLFGFQSSPLALYSLFNYIERLVEDLIIGLEKTVKMPEENISLQTQIVFGLYSIFSTIQDILFAIPFSAPKNQDGYQSSPADIEMLREILKIKRSYQEKRREKERQYLDRIDFDENVEVTNVLIGFKKYPSTIPLEDFNEFQTTKELYSKLGDFSMNSSLPMIDTLSNNLAYFAQLIEKNKIFMGIIKTNTSNISNLLIAKILVFFPYFRRDYYILRDKGIIMEKTDKLFWRYSTISLAEYFGDIYIEYINKEKKDEYEKKKIRIPWYVLEQVFDKKNLKDYYKKRGAIKSVDYDKISLILKNEAPPDDDLHGNFSRIQKKPLLDFKKNES